MTRYTDELTELRDFFRDYLSSACKKNAVVGECGILQAAEQDFYHGLWPDDFLFAQAALGNIAKHRAEARKLLRFLTDSIVDLPCVPDRVEPDGLPVMRPGPKDAPIGSGMPTHLPAAWVRLLSYYESEGIEIPRKSEWLDVIARSFAAVPFSRGLVYIDPQDPRVSFGFHDPVAITGFEFMSSVVLHKGLLRACELFFDCSQPELIFNWLARANGIKGNLARLFDENIGGFVAGSCDCRQFDVWGNGLCYGMFGDSPDVQSAIASTLLSQKDKLFKYGFTRQIIEPEWQRLAVFGESRRLDNGKYSPASFSPIPQGEYVNGAHWLTGTGFVIGALYSANPGLALTVLQDAKKSTLEYNCPEWISPSGEKRGSSNFITGAALTVIALNCILEGKPLIDFF